MTSLPRLVITNGMAQNVLPIQEAGLPTINGWGYGTYGILWTHHDTSKFFINLAVEFNSLTHFLPP